MAPASAPPNRQPLTRAECLSHLASATLARIVMTVKALPAAFPAHIALAGDHLLVASGDQAVLDAVTHREVMTVQVDGLDERGSPWTVAATGHAAFTTETPPVALHEARRHDDQLITVSLEVVSGQRTP
jgi:Pyridoxamine 5'-phosphate oxidase